MGQGESVDSVARSGAIYLINRTSVMRRATLVSLATFALTLLASIASVAAAQSGEAAEHTVTVDGISRRYLVFAEGV